MWNNNKNTNDLVVAYRYRKSISIIERVTLHICIEFFCIIFQRSLPLCVEIFWVGDNRRTVNTSKGPRISDQLGTENACLTLLCWFIVMIWVSVCNDVYRYQYERHLGSFTIIQQFKIKFQLSVYGVNTDPTDNFLLKYNDKVYY